MSSSPLNIICLATYFKGVDFIRECKSHGAQIVLITKEKMLGEAWPRESLDELIALPNDANLDLFIHLIGLLARQTRIDRVVALEEFDVLTAAQVREHFCLPGMTSATARLFRDKLAMAACARQAGVNVPEFVPLVNHDEVRQFMERVPPPWIIKPRSDVSAIGIKKAQQPGEVWRAIDDLDARERFRERSSHYLLARFVSGEVFHVDSLVNNGRVVFAGANKYGRPPMEVAHKGGAYFSRTIPHGTADEKALFEFNRKLVKALGLEKGAAHAEFIKSDQDGQFYFLEIAARVGGAYIADVLEAASGVNLWREWARLELADQGGKEGRREGGTGRKGDAEAGRSGDAETGRRGEGGTGRREGKIKPLRKEYAGIILSLARQEYPDTSSYSDPEIAYRVNKKHHAGLIVQSKSLERVQELLNQYSARFTEDFAAVLPPLERAE
ncbi:MAG: ATP-grasp domain-containing protein [Acidobacteria bacterium]|nr:ATP-grasp domain-containing protein [Acidobacteriota bacterium]